MKRSAVTGWARSFAVMCASALGASVVSMTAAAVAHGGIELTTEVGGVDAAAQPPAAAEKPPAAAEKPPGAAAQPPANVTRSGRILLDGENRVRMEIAKPSPTGDAKSVMIYRGDREVVWTVDDKRRTYTEVDRARMTALRDQSSAAREKMRAELDKMPPEKRAQMSRMLAAADAKEPERGPPTIKSTGRSDKIGGLACQEVEVSRGDVKESEICVADWKAAGVTKADLAAIRKLGTFQDETLGGMQARREGGNALELFDSLDGLPVRVRTFRGGQLKAEFRVVKVEHKPLDPKLFDPPDGYTKREFSISMPGAGRPRSRKPSAPGT